MNAIFEQAVREHAYTLWIEAGMVHGMDRIHWLTAETAVMRMAQPTASSESAAVKPPVAKATTKAVASKSVTAKKGGQKAPAKVAKVAGEAAGKVTGKSAASMKASSAASSHLAN